VSPALKENRYTVIKSMPILRLALRPAAFLSRCWRKHGRGETGAELLEFAICANVFFLFCFGFLQLCLVLFSLHCVGEASRQTARWASVRGTASSVTSGGATSCLNPNISTCPAADADVLAFAQKQPGMGAGSTGVTVNWCNSDGVTGCVDDNSNAKPGNVIKVTVTYTYASVPFVRSSGLTLTSTASKVIWQ
jgi:Flp pilus assembly protein TadG